jgi:hypothetical protein
VQAAAPTGEPAHALGELAARAADPETSDEAAAAAWRAFAAATPR